jgi:hypothetical protein
MSSSDFSLYHGGKSVSLSQFCDVGRVGILPSCHSGTSYSFTSSKLGCLVGSVSILS